MQKVTLLLDDDEYADWFAYAKAKGYTGKHGLAVMFTAGAQKSRNVAKLTDEERPIYEAIKADTIDRLRSASSGTIHPTNHDTV